MLLIRNKPLRLLGGALETFSFLSLKLFLRNRAQWSRFSGKVFREYMSLVEQERWRSAPLEAILPGVCGQRIVLEHLAGEGINAPIDELAYLALITAAMQPRAIFEIGTFRGRTALNFALNSPPACRIYTLDLPPAIRDEFKQKTNVADAQLIELGLTGIDYQGKPGSEKITQLLGNSLTFDFSPYHGRMDLVFVDGAHHHEAALSDTRQAIKMLAPGGLIVWHDFANYGDYNDVTRAILEVLPAQEIIQIANSQLAVYRHAPSAERSERAGSGMFFL